MRTAITVDRDLFAKAVQEAEANGPLANLGALHNKIADLYNLSAGTLPTITFSIANLRIQEYGLTVQTKAGKRGREPGQKMSEEHKQKMLAARQNTPRKKRSETFKKNPKIVAGFVQMRKNLRELANGSNKFEKTVDRIEKGSTKAAHFVNCIQCIGGSYRDAKNCQEACCPFYALTCGIFKRGQTVAAGSPEVDEEMESLLNEDEDADVDEAEEAA